MNQNRKGSVNVCHLWMRIQFINQEKYFVHQKLINIYKNSLKKEIIKSDFLNLIWSKEKRQSYKFTYRKLKTNNISGIN